MGFAVSIPLLLEVSNGTNNMIAIVFDSILSFLIFGYFGFLIYKKLKIKVQ